MLVQHLLPDQPLLHELSLCQLLAVSLSLRHTYSQSLTWSRTALPFVATTQQSTLDLKGLFVEWHREGLCWWGGLLSGSGAKCVDQHSKSTSYIQKVPPFEDTRTTCHFWDSASATSESLPTRSKVES